MNANKAGHRIRIARNMQKPIFRQDDLVARMELKGFKMTKNMLSRIELGERYITDVELIGFSTVLNVSILWLLEETNDSEINRL